MKESMLVLFPGGRPMWLKLLLAPRISRGLDDGDPNAWRAIIAVGEKALEIRRQEEAA